MTFSMIGICHTHMKCWPVKRIGVYKNRYTIWNYYMLFAVAIHINEDLKNAVIMNFVIGCHNLFPLF